jgi:hypothetical protein
MQTASVDEPQKNIPGIADGWWADEPSIEQEKFFLG